MNSAVWDEVDTYAQARLLPPDSILDAVLAANQAAGLPAIDVSPLQGQLLQILVEMSGARRILEIGTLGGYSSICMARALPVGGHLISLEYVEQHANTAHANIERAGLTDKVEIIVGAAADRLPELEARGDAPFDFVFIDADKPNNPTYLEWALRLSRSGAVIVCDNVIRDGAVVDPHSQDANVNGARAAFDFVAARLHLRATALQTVGSKGYDGFIVLINRPVPQA